jgi:hypothetical protein
MLTAAVVLATLIVTVGSAAAAAQAAGSATIHIDDTTPRPGQVVRVTGTCPTPRVPVVVYSDNPVEDRTGEDRVDLGRTTAGADGAFAVTGTIPADLDPNLSVDGGPRGAWLVAVECANGLAQAGVTITLDGSGSGAPRGAGELARTGTGVAPLALLAMAAIVLGGVLLGWSRRPRRPEAAGQGR